jgi:hypothetical protein
LGVGAGRKGWPARWGTGGQARRPRRFGETGEEGVDFDNKRTVKVPWGLVRLLERLAGGERKRGSELTAAAAMTGGELGMARCGEERAAFIGGLGPMVTTA